MNSFLNDDTGLMKKYLNKHHKHYNKPHPALDRSMPLIGLTLNATSSYLDSKEKKNEP